MLIQAPKCPTCGCDPVIPCVVDSDDFDRANDATSPGPKWVEESGNFQVNSNRMDPPDSGGGYARFLTPVPTTDTDGYKWSFVVNFGSGNGTVRAVVDQIDGDTTYSIYAEVSATSSTSFSIRLWDRTAGADFAFTLAKGVSSVVRANDATVTVCVIGNRVTATVRQNLSSAVVQNTTTLHTGGATSARFVGIEVTSVHSSARIDDASLSRIGGPSDCPNCDVPCARCEDDSAPAVLQVDLSGFTGTLATINGSYFVPFAGCPFAGTSSACPDAFNQEIGSGAKYRTGEIFSDAICSSSPNTITFMEVLADIDMSAGVTSPGTIRINVAARLRIDNSSFGSCSTQDFRFNVSEVPASDCSDIDEEIPLGAITPGSPVIGSICGSGSDYAGATCHVSVAV